MTDFNREKNRRILVIDDNPAIHEDFRKILGGDPAGTQAIDLAEAALFGEASDPPPKSEVQCPMSDVGLRTQDFGLRNGFEMDSALQGREGLERVQQALAEGRPYAMAFIDVRMPPGWDGIETTSKIWEVYPDLQVVICTAYSDYSWDEMLAKIGQSDRLVILKKPFDNVEVLQLANALTEKWRLVRQVRLQIEDLEQAVQRRTAELQKSDERFRLIAVVDTAGQRIYNSPSYQKLLGYSAEELQSSTAFSQIHPEDSAKVQAATQASLKSQVRSPKSDDEGPKSKIQSPQCKA